VLDPKVIRENPDVVKAGAIKKHLPERAEAVDRFLVLDRELRDLIPTIDGMRSEQKAASKAIGKVMGSLSAADREEFLTRQKTQKAELSALEERQRVLNAERNTELLKIPNIPADDVPEGKDDQFNVEIRTWGEIPERDFEVRPHYELGEGWRRPS